MKLLMFNVYFVCLRTIDAQHCRCLFQQDWLHTVGYIDKTCKGIFAYTQDVLLLVIAHTDVSVPSAFSVNINKSVQLLWLVWQCW